MTCRRPSTFPRKGLPNIILLLLLSIQAATPAASLGSAAGPWVLTGSLSTARYSHTATLLPDGKVLVTGGAKYINSSSAQFTDDGYGALGNIGGTASAIVPFAGAEVYDPSSGHWATTGAMKDARVFHTATLLSNGKVLVTGGWSTDASPLSSAELYDPATGSWHVTGSMNTPRMWHTATLLTDGKVLVAGGWYGSDSVTHMWIPTTAAETYDPTTGTWSPTASMGTARAIHTATRLPDGTVLIVGGQPGGGGSVKSSEVYHPMTGLWSPGGESNVARAYHRAVLLPNDKVLAAGGGYWSGYPEGHYFPTNSVEEYQPSTNGWNVTGDLSTPRMGHSMALLNNGRLLVAGGFQGPLSDDNTLASAEVYHPDTGTWGAITSMNVARNMFTATPLSGGSRVLVVGGRTSAGETATAEIYDDLTAKVYLPLTIR